MVYAKNLVKGKRYVEFYLADDLRIVEYSHTDRIPEVAIGRQPFFKIIVGRKRKRELDTVRLNLLHELGKGMKQHVVKVIFRDGFKLM